MANKWGNDLKVKVDNSAKVITEITAYTNQAGIQGAADILDQTGFGNTNPDILHGIARAVIPLNGWVNSTTDGVWGAHVGTRTSVTLTAGFYNGEKWYNGEFLPDSVQYSGTPATLQTWSANLLVDGAINRTSADPT